MNPWVLGALCGLAGAMGGASLGVLLFAMLVSKDDVPGRFLLGRCGSCREPIWGGDDYRITHRQCPGPSSERKAA